MTTIPTTESITRQGGVGYVAHPLIQLERFLILGTTSGTLYQSQEDITKQNLDNIRACIKDYPKESVDMIVRIGRSNRAIKHDPCLVAYAMACSEFSNLTDELTVATYALTFFTDVVRIPTHLFNFLTYVKNYRGTGPSLRKAINRFYDRNGMALARMVTKYQGRNGWTHDDVFRVTHPIPQTRDQQTIFHYVTHDSILADGGSVSEYLEAAERCLHSEDVNEVVSLIDQYNLPLEVVPTRFKNAPEVFAATIGHIGGTAVIRGLRSMANSGWLVEDSEAEKSVIERLLDSQNMAQNRVHPAQFFMAKKANIVEDEEDDEDFYYSSYRQRYVEPKSILPSAVDAALDQAFLDAFHHVEPSNKRILVGIDVSGSMTHLVSGVKNVSCREAAALMALVISRTEPNSQVMAFSSGFIPFPIGPEDTVTTIMSRMDRMPFDNTDVSRPIKWAMEKDLEFDAFVVITDNETGFENPSKVLQTYRDKTENQGVKLVTMCMIANDRTVADPNDVDMLDVVGFDTASPKILSTFIGGFLDGGE